MSFHIQPNSFTGELNAIGTTKLFPLGTVVTDQFGNDFVYVKAGGTTLGAGLLQTVITTGTNEQTVTVAHGIGTSTVHVTAAAITAGDFEDGLLVVTAGTAIGESYHIRNNTTTDDPSSGLIALDLYEPLKTAWSTSDTDVTLYPSPFLDLVVNVTDAQQKPTCCTQWPITTLYYGWALKDGYGSLQMDVAASAGLELDEKNILASTNHAGFGMLDDAPASQTANTTGFYHIGEVIPEADATDNEACLVRIRL